MLKILLVFVYKLTVKLFIADLANIKSPMSQINFLKFGSQIFVVKLEYQN